MSYLKSLDDAKILIDLEDISDKFSVDIDELYDTYPTYFDNPPNDRVYDYKDLDYGKNVFLRNNESLISEIFSSSSEEIKKIKEVDELFDNKRRLTAKYSYSDYYYLETGSTVSEIISGKLFEADNPILNFLNRYYPTTASTEHPEYLKTHREVGFFRPSKVSIVVIDGIQKGFEFDKTKLSPNTLYFFPDPHLIGKNGDIIIFTVDDSYLKKNPTSGKAYNEPNSFEYDSKYYGYVSKIDQNSQKYLDDLYNYGIIADSKHDIYGNTYALFKSGIMRSGVSSGNSNPNSPTTINTTGNTLTPKYSIILDGYKYYDNFFGEGFSFDYTVEDLTTFSELKRTGITINGNGFTSIPTTTLYLGTFGSSISNGQSFVTYPQPTTPTSQELTPVYEILEGGFITKNNNTLYPDPVSSDLSAFEVSTDSFYYTDLIEGGIYSSSQRALLDISFPTLSARFVNYNRDTVNSVDGEKFGVYFDRTTTYSNPYAYSDTVSAYTKIQPEQSYTVDNVVMVKNSFTRETKNLMDALPYLNTRYPNTVVNELNSNIYEIDSIQDTLFLKTDHYLTMDKILFKDGNFVDPKNALNYITHNQNEFDHISNRLKVNTTVYVCKIALLSSETPKSFTLYPIIYKFNTNEHIKTIILNKNIENVTNSFQISSNNIRYVTVNDIFMTHNTKNDIFSISFLVKDQNYVSKLHTMDYYLHPDPIFISHKCYNFGALAYTTVFDGEIPSNIESYLSGSVSYSDTELIL
jgi:hypothetical protein